MYVCVFVLFPSKGFRTRTLSSTYKTEEAYRMSFLPSHLMEEISPNTEALIANI